MKTTIPTAVSDRQLRDEKDLVPYINKELLPLAREFRAAHNTEALQTFTVTTAATGTFTTIWTSDPMPTNSIWRVLVTATAFTTAGAAQQCAYTREACFANAAGVVGQVGATAVIATFETAAAADVQFALSGQTILFQVRDDGASTFTWKAVVRVLASDEI